MSTAPQTTDDLRAAAIAAEQAPVNPPAPPAPEVTEIDGIKYGKTPEGKYFAELPTGAKYIGDSEQQVAINIAKGKVEADRTIHSLKNPQPAPTPEPAEPADVIAARNILLDEVAKGIGLSSGQELQQRLGIINRVAEEQTHEQIAAGFYQMCPEFPTSEQATETLLQIKEQNGFPDTPQGLRAAHMIAMAEGKYKPLSQEQIQAQRMQALGIPSEALRPPTPAPMIPGSAPNGTSPVANPWDRKNTSLEALRQAALEAERG